MYMWRGSIHRLREAHGACSHGACATRMPHASCSISIPPSSLKPMHAALALFLLRRPPWLRALCSCAVLFQEPCAWHALQCIYLLNVLDVGPQSGPCLLLRTAALPRFGVQAWMARCCPCCVAAPRYHCIAIAIADRCYALCVCVLRYVLCVTYVRGLSRPSLTCLSRALSLELERTKKTPRTRVRS